MEHSHVPSRRCHHVADASSRCRQSGLDTFITNPLYGIKEGREPARDPGLLHGIWGEA